MTNSDQQIVVIDDEPGVLSVLRDLLEMEGFSVICLEGPEQVEELKGGADPSLFLIDIMLPGISGIELAERLRAQSFSKIPMIAMSASAFMVGAARETGLFQDAINKPFDLNRVLDAIARHMV